MTKKKKLRRQLYDSFKNRAVLYWLFYDELRREVGAERAEEILKRGVYRRGAEKGSQYTQYAPSDLEGLQEDFLDGIVDNGRMFEPEVLRSDAEAFGHQVPSLSLEGRLARGGPARRRCGRAVPHRLADRLRHVRGGRVRLLRRHLAARWRRLLLSPHPPRRRQKGIGGEMNRRRRHHPITERRDHVQASFDRRGSCRRCGVVRPGCGGWMNGPRSRSTSATRRSRSPIADCPYHIGGLIPERQKLLVATPDRFRDWLNIEVCTRREVKKIDRKAKSVEVLDLATGQTAVCSVTTVLVLSRPAPRRSGRGFQASKSRASSCCGTWTIWTGSRPGSPIASPRERSSSVADTSAWRWSRTSLAAAWA